MIAIIALSLISGPVVLGSIESVVPIEPQIKIGSANRYGVVLAQTSRPYFNSTRLETPSTLVFIAGTSLRDGRYMKMSVTPGILEKLPTGAVIGPQIVDSNGKMIANSAGMMVNGANSKGDLVGYDREIPSRLDRATILKGGIKRFTSFPPAQDYVAVLDQHSLFSQAFDIDDNGRVLAVSLPERVDGNKVNALKPYIVENGTQKQLEIPTGYTDVFPLKFAFDGSIIGWAWDESTITKTGWSGGFGQAYSTTFLRWPSAAKITNPSVGWTREGETMSNMVDASGPYAIGEVRKGSIYLTSPSIWVNGEPADLKLPSRTKVASYLGFIKPNTVACLGDVNGKWSLFTVQLPRR